jgi:hypothetical protein
MSGPTDESDELPSKIRHQRIELLRTQLKTCFTLISVAEAARGMGNIEHAKRAALEAEKGYATVRRLLSDPMHTKNLSPEEHGELTGKLEDVRKKLNDLK